MDRLAERHAAAGRIGVTARGGAWRGCSAGEWLCRGSPSPPSPQWGVPPDVTAACKDEGGGARELLCLL